MTARPNSAGIISLHRDVGITCGHSRSAYFDHRTEQKIPPPWVSSRHRRTSRPNIDATRLMKTGCREFAEHDTNESALSAELRRRGHHRFRTEIAECRAATVHSGTTRVAHRMHRPYLVEGRSLGARSKQRGIQSGIRAGSERDQKCDR